MTEQALNALRALARIPIEREYPGQDDDYEILDFGDCVLTVGHVRDARMALKQRVE